jgi:hypothetical protein
MVISMILDFGFWMAKFEFSKEQSQSFSIPPSKTPSFFLQWTMYAISLYSNASRLL